MNVGFYRADLAGRGFLTQGKQGFVFPSIYLYHLDWYVGNTQITSIGDLCCDAGRVFVFSSYTCNRRSHLWDYVEPREAFCYFLGIVSPNGCLVLPLSSTPFSFLLCSLCSPFVSFLLLSSFLEGGDTKFVLSCVIQHEAGGLSKTLVFTKDVDIPVADEEKSVEETQAMGFAEDEIRKHFLAWNILCRAIKGKADNDILRRVISPTAAWRILVGSYSATTRGAKLQP